MHPDATKIIAKVVWERSQLKPYTEPKAFTTTAEAVVAALHDAGYFIAVADDLDGG